MLLLFNCRLFWMKIDEIKSIINSILIDIMVYEKNGFEKREYYIVSRLMWAIDNYPQFEIPYTSVSIFKDYNSYTEEYNIRFQDDILWVGVQGLERSPCGSDLYENENINISHDEAFSQLTINPNYEFDDLVIWYEEAKQKLESGDYSIVLEYYN